MIIHLDLALQLDRSQLPVPFQSILDHEIDLGTVESAFRLSQMVVLSGFYQALAQALGGLLPQCISPRQLVFAKAQLGAGGR